MQKDENYQQACIQINIHREKRLTKLQLYHKASLG